MRVQTKLPCPKCGEHDNNACLRSIKAEAMLYAAECCACRTHYLVRVDVVFGVYSAPFGEGAAVLVYQSDTRYAVPEEWRYIDTAGNPLSDWRGLSK